MYFYTIMYRQIVAIFLLIAFAAQVFNRAVIVMDYYANTGAYAKNCVNKARPQMHCNGKCQMMKKLKEEERKEQQNPERRGENKSEVVSPTACYTVFEFHELIIAKIYSSHFDASLSTGYYPGIFHPPGLV